LFEFAIAECLALGIFGLAEAVGVEEETVAGGEGNLANGKITIERRTEEQAIAFDTGQPAAGGTLTEEG